MHDWAEVHYVTFLMLAAVLPGMPQMVLQVPPIPHRHAVEIGRAHV